MNHNKTPIQNTESIKGPTSTVQEQDEKRRQDQNDAQQAASKLAAEKAARDSDKRVLDSSNR